MSYRVETALSKRAGCQATECKANGVKIDKDDLRLGIWVEYGDHGGWSWRHWGCVTGKVLQGLRDLVADPDKPGEYRWDMLDGFESGDKNSLDKQPKLQEKVRRCITQGFIDHEDFNGDPEMNVLGAVGLHTKESKKKMRDEKKEKTRNDEIDNLKAQLTTLQAEKADGGGSELDAKITAAQAELDKRLSANTPASKKRVKNEEDVEEGTPAKKKRVTKKKAKAEDYEDEAEDEDAKPTKPAPKSRAKKVKKEEENDDNADETKSAPAKKSRAKKAVKKEDEDNEEDAQESKPVPAKKPRAKRAVKKDEDTQMSGTDDDHTGVKDEDDAGPTSKPAPKKRAPAKQKVVKEEIDDNVDSAVKDEDGEDSVKPAPKKRAPRAKKAVKDEPTDDGAGLDRIESKPKPAAKKGRKKAIKDENVEEKDVKDEPAAESSNPGVTEGSSVLSDILDPPEIGYLVSGEDASTSEAKDEVKDLVVPPKNRRTRSRTASNKV